LAAGQSLKPVISKHNLSQTYIIYMNKFREQSPSIVLFTGNAKLLKYTLGSQPHEASAVLVSKPRCVEVK